MTPCFIELVGNLELILRSQLSFRKDSKYNDVNNWMKNNNHHFPIGHLKNDVEIQFVHYKSENEAMEKWNRRLRRIHWDNLFFKLDEVKFFSDTPLIEKFYEVCKTGSLSFTNIVNNNPRRIHIPDWSSNGATLFYTSAKYINIIDWLNHDKIASGLINKIFHKTCYPKFLDNDENFYNHSQTTNP